AMAGLTEPVTAPTMTLRGKTDARWHPRWFRRIGRHSAYLSPNCTSKKRKGSTMNRSQRGTTQSWEAASTAATAGFRTRLFRGAAWALSVALLAGSAGTEDAPAPATDGAVQAFTTANIFDGTGAPVVQNGTILVQAGRIAGGGASVQAPEGAEVVDVGGRFVMPGMLDARAPVDPNGSGPNPQEQLEQ